MCWMIVSYCLVLSTDPSISWFQFCSTYIYWFPTFTVHVIWVSYSKDHVHKLNKCSSYAHEWAFSLYNMVAATEERTLASKDLFFYWQMEDNTRLQWCRTGHPGHLGTLWEYIYTLQVVSFLVLVFLSQKNIWDVFCPLVHTLWHHQHKN